MFLVCCMSLSIDPKGKHFIKVNGQDTICTYSYVG